MSPLINHAPQKAVLLSPAHQAINQSINTVLQVRVLDSDNDTLTVSFYNAVTQTLIKKLTNIVNGSIAQTTWTNLSYFTTYSWYVITNDSKTQNTSQTWSFTTLAQPSTTLSLNLQGGLGLTGIINNTGSTTITDITWGITIHSLRNIHPINVTKGTTITLQAHKHSIIHVLPKGTGIIRITLTTSCPKSTPITKTGVALQLRHRTILLTTA